MLKKVLVIDDDPAIQDTLRLIFERAGYDVTILSSAGALISDVADIPDIYILDKQLPGIDGLDVCRSLKGHWRSAHVPVIMVSASPHIARLAKEACADDFLEKPFKRRDLLGMVEKYLSRNQG